MQNVECAKMAQNILTLRHYSAIMKSQQRTREQKKGGKNMEEKLERIASALELIAKLLAEIAEK